jgi:hypothetical protein
MTLLPTGAKIPPIEIDHLALAGVISPRGR